MTDKKLGALPFIKRMSYLDEAVSLSKYIIGATTDKEDAPEVLKAARKLALLVMKEIMR